MGLAYNPAMSLRGLYLITPDDDDRDRLIERVAGVLRQALAEPAARDGLQRFSQFPDFRDPGAFARTVREDDAFYRELIARLGIRLE